MSLIDAAPALVLRPRAGAELVRRRISGHTPDGFFARQRAPLVLYRDPAAHSWSAVQLCRTTASSKSAGRAALGGADRRRHQSS